MIISSDWFVEKAFYASGGKYRRRKFFRQISKFQIKFFIWAEQKFLNFCKKIRRFKQNCIQLVQNNFLRIFLLRRLFFWSSFEKSLNIFRSLKENFSTGLSKLSFSRPEKKKLMRGSFPGRNFNSYEALLAFYRTQRLCGRSFLSAVFETSFKVSRVTFWGVFLGRFSNFKLFPEYEVKNLFEESFFSVVNAAF